MEGGALGLVVMIFVGMVIFSDFEDTARNSKASDWKSDTGNSKRRRR